MNGADRVIRIFRKRGKGEKALRKKTAATFTAAHKTCKEKKDKPSFTSGQAKKKNHGGLPSVITYLQKS